jgi:hypothetical protein
MSTTTLSTRQFYAASDWTPREPVAGPARQEMRAR